MYEIIEILDCLFRNDMNKYICKLPYQKAISEGDFIVVNFYKLTYAYGNFITIKSTYKIALFLLKFPVFNFLMKKLNSKIFTKRFCRCNGPQHNFLKF